MSSVHFFTAGTGKGFLFAILPLYLGLRIKNSLSSAVRISTILTQDSCPSQPLLIYVVEQVIYIRCLEVALDTLDPTLYQYK